MKRKARTYRLGDAGIVQSKTGPDWGFIYRASTVKDDAYNVGDIVALPDGREFVYSKSSASCISGQGAEFTKTGYTSYTAFTTAAAVGATEITAPAATHDALTEDALAGGYAIIFDGSGNNVQFRGIVGNAAAAANAAFKLQLDGPLTEAITTSSALETYESPYIGLRTGTSANLPKAGVPAVKITAANVYFWCQTKGLCWVAPQSTVVTNETGCMWRHDGSLQDVEVAIGGTTDANCGTQYAGHRVQGDYSGNGPLFYLGM